jgi:hypothetical protein
MTQSTEDGGQGELCAGAGAGATNGPGTRSASAATRPRCSGCANWPSQAIAGYRVEFGTASTWAESADLMRVGADAVAAEPSGIAVTGTMAWFGSKLGLLDIASLRRTDGVAAKTAIDSSVDAARDTPARAWLSSTDNSRRSQIEAGRAYLRTDLAAASLGLAIHPNSQVLQEFPEMAELYSRFHAEVAVAQPSRVQMFVRLGHASRPEPAPRRKLDQFVRA